MKKNQIKKKVLLNNIEFYKKKFLIENILKKFESNYFKNTKA